MREAYFTGADDPHAELYSTESRPFRPPETGRIAVKVIHLYGDEVMQVYDVPAT